MAKEVEKAPEEQEKEAAPKRSATKRATAKETKPMTKEELISAIKNMTVLDLSELVKALEPLFRDDPRYWLELGGAHLRCGNADEAREALTHSRDAGGNRPDLGWMMEHVDDLVAVAGLQVEWEERLVPGGSTGLDGPYLGQTPPGREPEVFAPGILSTAAHEYHLSFAPDGREIIFSRSQVGSLVTRWEGDAMARCETCGKPAKSAFGLQSHMRSHK